MRTGSAAQLFGQLADLIDDRSNCLDRIEKRCIRRDINAGHFCQLFRCLRASGGQYLFPVIDSGLAFGFDALAYLGLDYVVNEGDGAFYGTDRSEKIAADRRFHRARHTAP